MRAFTREAYQRLAVQTSGMEFAAEMVAPAERIGLKVAEAPVDYHPRAGVSKLRTYRDVRRHLRFLLMYSPTWLYMVPSLLLTIVGLWLLVTLSLSTFTLFHHQGYAPVGHRKPADRAGEPDLLARHISPNAGHHPRFRPRGPVHHALLSAVHV